MTQGSLAYRKHAEAIRGGQVPDKYSRLLPFIRGRNILEIGAAEGVLSLLMSDRDPQARVTALELRPERHEAACDLQRRWIELGRQVDGCTMVCGNISDRLDLLEGVDTLVAIRTIYHLREQIDPVLAAARKHVQTVVLGGNPNRARRYALDTDEASDTLGAFNFYAGAVGMRTALQRAGFTIERVVEQGDPIVVGTR